MKLSENMLESEVTMTMRELQELVLDQAKMVLTKVVGDMAKSIRDLPDQSMTATLEEYAQLLEDIVGDWKEMDLTEFLP